MDIKGSCRSIREKDIFFQVRAILQNLNVGNHDDAFE